MTEPLNRDRLQLVLEQVTGLMLDENITCLPVDPFRIATHQGWQLATYAQVAKRAGEQVDFFAMEHIPEEGHSLYHPATGRYTILYDHTCTPVERLRFTLFHEMGHIVLGHFQQPEPDCLSL